MGTLRSQVNHAGAEINGVTLGQPIAPVHADGSPSQAGDSMADLFWAWDDSRLPGGTVELIDGELVVTPDEVALP